MLRDQASPFMNHPAVLTTNESSASAPTAGLDATLAHMLRTSPDWESWLSPEGHLVWVSDSVLQVTGYLPAECFGMATYPASLVYPLDADRFERFLAVRRQDPTRHHVHVRVQRQDLAIIWVSLSWLPVLADDGRLLGTRISIRDLSQTVPNEYGATLRKAATRLMQQAMRATGGLPEVYAQLTLGAAQSMNVARVGIWLFDAQREHLNCADLCLLETGQHEQSARLVVADYPHYVHAISSDQLVAVHDACHDELTRELAEPYLRPLGIGALLDAPIVHQGETVGVLCCEHVGSVRYWGIAEQAFAETLADFIALSLESAQRVSLEQQTQRLASVIEASPDLVSTVTVDGKVTYLNRSGRLMMGLNPSTAVKPPVAEQFYSPQRWQHRQEVALPHAIARGAWSGETELLTHRGEAIPVWQTIIAHRDPQGELAYLSSITRDLREQKRVEVELRKRGQQLQTLNDELERRVADRTRQLEEVNQNLETFAFSVSHDLKAPLRGIEGYSRLLEEDYRAQLPAEAQTFIDSIRSATQRMHDLIDDLLAYSRVGRRELSASRFSVRQAIQRVLAEREHDLHDAHTTLVNHIEDLSLHADLDCFIQIMRNLIDNAVKFTRDASAPTIELNSQLTPGHVVFSVKDNGCGFDMKYHDRIFSIFQRLHRTEDYPGTGVGLAIVSKAAERLGGKVWATSQPGQGTTFFLELPHVP